MYIFKVIFTPNSKMPSLMPPNRHHCAIPVSGTFMASQTSREWGRGTTSTRGQVHSWEKTKMT